jgi:hypothetical protein
MVDCFGIITSSKQVAIFISFGFGMSRESEPDFLGMLLANKGYYPLFDDFSLSQGIVGARYPSAPTVIWAHRMGISLGC